MILAVRVIENNSELKLANVGLYLFSSATLVLYAACALGCSAQNFTNPQTLQRLCHCCLETLASHFPSPCDR